jgi:hypothetical protein
MFKGQKRIIIGRSKVSEKKEYCPTPSLFYIKVEKCSISAVVTAAIESIKQQFRILIKELAVRYFKSNYFINTFNKLVL